MNPPFYRLTAICARHGEVTVERKRNPKAGQRTEAGGMQSPYPSSVVCPKCPWHAVVFNAVEVTE